MMCSMQCLYAGFINFNRSSITYYEYQMRTISSMGISASPGTGNAATVEFYGGIPSTCSHKNGKTYHLEYIGKEGKIEKYRGDDCLFLFDGSDYKKGFTKVADIVGDIKACWDYSTNPNKKGSSYGVGGSSGTGSYNNGGTGSSSSSSTCRSCSGTGNCTMCHGRGGYYHNAGTYVGDTGRSWTDCPACNGSGKCQVCYGRGSIR